MNAGFLDPDQLVVEHVTRFVSGIDRRGKTFVDIIVTQFAQRFTVAFPERFEHHLIGPARTFHELRQIECAVGLCDFAHAAFDCGHDAFKLDRAGGHAADSLRRVGRLPHLRIGIVTRVETLRHRFLFVFGPAAKHRIQAQAQKSRNRGEDDDF